MFLLKCRTAFIGLIISVFILLNYKYKLLGILKQQFSIYKLLSFIGIGLFALILSASYTLKSKQDSTNGRVFIWERCIEIIKDRPLIGFGLDRFGFYYNHKQAKYFENGLGTEAEIKNASFVQTSYNELLQHTVEGGAIALIILTLFYLSLGIQYSKTMTIDSITAYAGVVSFIAMSFFNFSFAAIPAMCLFLIYIAIVSCNSNKLGINIKSNGKYLIITLAMILSSYLCYSILTNASISNEVKKASNLNNINEIDDRIEKFESLYPKSKHSLVFLNNYANALTIKKDYKKAIEIYQQANTIIPSDNSLLQLAYCYQQVKLFQKGIEVCKLAGYITPNRVLPLYAQMNMYLAAKDSFNALDIANQIVNIVPKVKSTETDWYKQKASEFLNNPTIKNIK